jgi:hypothetical protein
MEDQLITFETAKLAKEKGFDLVVKSWYLGEHKFTNHAGLEHLYGNHNRLPKRYSAPTQSLVQRWLREKHNIHIDMTYIPSYSNSLDMPGFYEAYVFGELLGKGDDVQLDGKTYEDALEKGLQEALKLIKL